MLGWMTVLVGLSGADVTAPKMDVTVSSGFLGAWGLIGIGVEARWNMPWVGVAAGASAGPIPTASLGLWWPEGSWRPGLQVDAGATPWGGSCGVDPDHETNSCRYFAAGMNLMLEKNEIWRGLLLRGGVGPNVVMGGGGAAGLLGTLGAGWRW